MVRLKLQKQSSYLLIHHDNMKVLVWLVQLVFLVFFLQKLKSTSSTDAAASYY